MLKIVKVLAAFSLPSCCICLNCLDELWGCLQRHQFLRWRGLFIRQNRGCAYWDSTNVKHPGLTMGKVRQISTNLDCFLCCTNNDSCSRIDCIKKSSKAIPISRCVQSCCNYHQFCSSQFLAVLPSFAHGDFWLVIVTAGLNAPAIGMVLNEFLAQSFPLLLSLFVQRKPSKLAEICLTFPMVNPGCFTFVDSQ